jgi:hypothetical protein
MVVMFAAVENDPAGLANGAVAVKLPKEVETSYDDLFGNVACFGVAEFLGLLRALARRGRLGQ